MRPHPVLTPFPCPTLFARPPLQVATSALQAVTSSSGAVQPQDLDALVDIAAAAAPALLPAGSLRRALLASAAPVGSQTALTALAVLSRTCDIVYASQAKLLAGMVRRIYIIKTHDSRVPVERARGP